MDWKTLYCPNPLCPFYGVRFGESRLVKNGTTRGQRQALCRACGSSIALTYGTPYVDLEHDPALFELAIRALAEGNAIRATARIIQHSRRIPHKELRDAQVVKTRERGRVVAVDHHVVFGDAQRIAALLAALPPSATINTSFVERENLALRQHNRRLMRKTNAFSKELPWLEKQLRSVGQDHTHPFLSRVSLLGSQLPCLLQMI